MFDPVLYDNTLFENADGMVLFCKQLLEKKGLTHLADTLETFYGVNTPSMARAAIQALEGIKTQDPEVTESLQVTKRLLLEAAGRA